MAKPLPDPASTPPPAPPSPAPGPRGTAETAAAHLRPIKSRSRVQQVLDALVAMVESAGLQVGDRLPPEQELAARLGVGRSTIREALNAWQCMGIVTRNKGAGTVLAAEVAANAIHVPLTLKLEAEGLLRTHAVRTPLEVEASALAARNASRRERALIRKRLAELMAVYEAGADWRQADERFHDAIHQACGNPLFQQLIQQIRGAFHDIYEAPFGQPQLGAATIPLHPALAEAIAEGRPDEAAAQTRRIMETVAAEVKAVIDE